jgi:tetratricopeptide (TPR) repeat protein
MSLNFISIVSCAFFCVWTVDAVGQGVREVEALNQQVLRLHKQGQYAQALELATKALKLSEDTLGPENAETADCLNNLGGMYQSLVLRRL